jgi:hypothetical protein
VARSLAPTHLAGPSLWPVECAAAFYEARPASGPAHACGAGADSTPPPRVQEGEHIGSLPLGEKNLRRPLLGSPQGAASRGARGQRCLPPVVGAAARVGDGREQRNGGLSTHAGRWAEAGDPEAPLGSAQRRAARSESICEGSAGSGRLEGPPQLSPIPPAKLRKTARRSVFLGTPSPQRLASGSRSKSVNPEARQAG